MDLNSPEIQKLLAAVTDRTEKGIITWEVLEYDPIGFMTEMGVEFNGSETENFAQNITFLCRLQKGRTIWLEAYESIGFPTPGGFPDLRDGYSLRGLAYITLRILSSRGQVLYRCGSIIQNRSHALLSSELHRMLFPICPKTIPAVFWVISASLMKAAVLSAIPSPGS